MLKRKFSRREKFSVVLSVVVALSFTYYSLFIKPNIRQIQVMSSEYQIIKHELEASRKLYNQIKKFDSSLKQKIPETRRFPELLIQLDQIIKNNNLKQIEIAPQKVEKKEGYFVLPINLLLEGNYMQIKGFFKDIEDFPRLLCVDNFVISFNKDKLTLKIKINVYFLKDKENHIPDFIENVGKSNPFSSLY